MIADGPGTAMLAGGNAPEQRVSEAGMDETVVDVLFELSGTRVPADCAAALALAVSAALPWFEAEPRAGIHPLRAAPSTHEAAPATRRARLAPAKVPSKRGIKREKSTEQESL